MGRCGVAACTTPTLSDSSVVLNATLVAFVQVEIAENHVCYFVLTNLARFNLEVSLEATGPCELLQYLEATPKKATTDVGTQLQLQLSFCPKNICNLQNIVLSIKVRKRPHCDV